MPKKKQSTSQKSELKQTDIVSAFRGKDEVFDELDDEEVYTKKKAVGLFDFVNDIRKSKSGELLDAEENLSSWNSYMILQALSMKEDDILFCNFFNKYQSSMTKKQMYLALNYIIPRDNKFYTWIKNKKDPSHDLISFVSTYFECSSTESLEYINIMGDEWAENIKNKFGGVVSTKKKKGKK